MPRAFRVLIVVVVAVVAAPLFAQLVVTPSNLQGWQLAATDASGATIPPPSAYLAPGFETPPLGSGSLHLAVGPDGGDDAQARHPGYAGTLLSNITALSYSTFVEVDGSGGQAPYLILNVDTDGDSGAEDLLFFEPIYQGPTFFPSNPQGPLTTDTWQSWDALAGGWYSVFGTAGSGPGVNVKSFATLVAALPPNANIINSVSGLGGVRIVTGFGSGAWDNFLGAADDFTIGVSGTDTTYDFEAAAATLVTVTTATPDGWVFEVDDEAPAGTTATVSIVSGPGTPPLGDGSLQLSVGTDGNDAAQARNDLYDGLFLRDLSELTYSTYVQVPGSGGQAPYIMLNVDYTGDGTFDDILFFEPEYQQAAYGCALDQGPIVVGSWQDWDAASGCWWSLFGTGGATPGAGVKPLADILAAQPDAQLTTDSTGALRVVAGYGSGAWDNFVGNVDALQVAFTTGPTLYDFEPIPVITIGDVAQAEGTGGTTNFVFTLNLSEAVSQTVTVDYTTADGTALAADGDYTPVTVPATATFTPGSTSTTITIVVGADTKFEPDETFFVNLSNPQFAALDADTQGQGTIENDDTQPTIVVTPDPLTQSEGTTNFVFNVTLSNASSQTITVGYTTTPGTATEGTDYADNTGTVTFVENDTAETITVVVTDDNIAEASENFFVDFGTPVNATMPDPQAEGVITDDDPTPTITIDSVSQLENAGSMVFTVTLSNPSSSTITVDYTTNGVTATEGTDYTDATATLTFVPGDTSETITVPITDDNISEADETFTVDLSNPTNATIGTGQGTGTIQNDDGVPTITIDSVSQPENAGNMVFTVTLSNPSSSTITVDYTTTGATATEGTDYTDATATLTFVPGDTSETITVTVIDDNVTESDETFTVDLSNPANATIGTPQGTGTIQNDDAQPTININDIAQAENSGTFVFTVTLSNPSASTVTVNFTTIPITANEVDDYNDSTGTLTFVPGDVSETITVTILDDGVTEPNEAFTVDLSAPTNATFGDDQGLGTIQNDEGLPTIIIDDVTQLENAGNMVFTVTLSNPSTSSILVSYTTNPGTAAEGADYTDATDTLVFNPGDTSETITVPIVDDNITEADETFTVDLSAPLDATISDGQGVGTIQNDDAVPAINIGDVTQAENAGNMIFTVTLSNPSSSTVTVNFTTNPVTATEGTDYSDATGTLTFLAGDVSETIIVPVIDDPAFEPTETFTVDLSGATNATIADPQATGTIVDNETQPTILIDDVSQNEGDAATTSFVFTVTLSGPSATPATVNFTTNPGTAIEGTDYADNTGIVTFAPGDVSETITVLITGDTDFEGNDTFFVDLSGATGASILDNQGLGTIVNDDGPVADLSITKTGPASADPDSNITYTITVTNAGPDTASNVVVTDVLPAGSSFVSATPSQGSCSGTTTVTCTLGAIASGGSATITLVIDPPNAGTVTNTATVTNTPETDPTPANNAGTVATAIFNAIPTLSEWALLALLLGLVAMAAVKLR